MSKILFFCEGDEQNEKSLDWQFFRKVLKDLPFNQKGMHSKRGRDRYTEGYADGAKINSKLNPLNTPIIVFRDRDFDIEVPENGTLFINGKTISGNRTTIENYLLSPELFVEFLKTHTKYQNIPIATVEDAIKLFQEAATSIKAHQAARHALGKITRLGIPQMPSNLKKANGNLLEEGVLPDDLTETGCLENGKRILQNYTTKASDINETLFETFYQVYLTQFDTDFIRRNEYFTWFNGKNIAMAIRNKYQNLDFKPYYLYAIEHFDYESIYDSANTQFPDLVALRELIISLSNE
jgi:hypothetical protein